MARTTIIATHGKLADGFRDSLNILATDSSDIITINAFSVDTNPKKTITALIQSIPQEDTVLIFTDLMCGSVNQMFLPLMGQRKMHLITGINLALVCQLVLCPDDLLTEEFIREAVELSRQEIKYVNDEVAQQFATPNKEEDEFF